MSQVVTEAEAPRTCVLHMLVMHLLCSVAVVKVSSVWKTVMEYDFEIEK
jgi:hypothetical protein